MDAQGFPGHRDIVSGLAFRQGTHELFSASFDRSVKTWSLDDRAYVDTLLGHQSEVLSIDLLRQVIPRLSLLHTSASNLPETKTVFFRSVECLESPTESFQDLVSSSTQCLCKGQMPGIYTCNA